MGSRQWPGDQAGFVIWGNDALFLILNSYQTKRKGDKGGPANWKHAGQIFCEMLGQVCHPEFYRAIEPSEYLEVYHRITMNLTHRRL